jgi:CHAT domain-containing protein
VLNNLAIDYFKEGRFNRYLNLEFKALAESKKEGNYKSQLDILKNLFLVYRARKNFDAAKQYLTQAQQLAEQKQNKANIAQLHYYEGLLYRDAKNNMDQALTSFNKALQLISYSSDYKIYRDILTKKALLLEKQEKYRSAKAIYQRVLKHAKERNDRSYALYTSFNKANTYLSLEQLNSARVMLDSLFTQNLSVLSFYQLVKARTVQAHFQAQTGEPGRGITIIQPVINQIVKRSRNSGSLETGFWQVEPEYLNAFQQYADMLIQTGQNREAVEVLDRFKTINSVAIYRNPLLRARVLNNKQLSEYKRLTNKLDGLRKKLIATPKKKRRAIQQQINKLSARKNAMDQKVTSRANLHAVSVRRIQQKMNAHQRVLDFTDLNNIYYEAVIARNSIHFKKIKLTPRRRALFTKSIKQIAHGNPDLTNLYAITRLLGINKLPAQVHKLTIMPDSYLYQLPLDVLPLTPPADSQNYGGVHYSIERFQTNYMTSLNDFNTTRDTVHYTYGYVGYGISQFGDGRPALSPLPRAKAEIEQSARELSALPQKKLFFNDSATWQAFKKAAPHARILHLATHSLVSGRNPLFSRIYLTPTDSSKEDERSGRVFAYQLFNLHLSNQLIMLNSCESGKGSYLQGTGVVGISRALRYAGANALVLNLWSVNDMLAEQFAVKFYEGINEGLAKSVALRRAKLYFLNKRNANPHYWGPYMLLGDNQPLITPHKKMNKMAAIAFITFFFVLAVASSIIAIRRKHN